MKILHTADWHIGRTLYKRKRYDEFKAFLKWLTKTIQDEAVDVLLIAGDIFDTTTPSNRSQELYYHFLSTLTNTCCQHVVVIAGNHDSPTFIDAPKQVLKALNVHVVGSVTENPEDEVLVLDNKLIICAVPYLRDRDIRLAEPGETLEDKEKKLIQGIHTHYQAVCEVAEEKRKECKPETPLIAMGHLFTAGGETVDGDGVRELYVGSLAHVTGAIFPTNIDYLALGHLHVPQKVNNSEIMRYSGSPIPMGFGEAKQTKYVCLAEFNGREANVQTMTVPTFQQLEQIKGSLNEISARIIELKESTAWLEIVYDGEEVIGNLRETLEEMTFDTNLEILRIQNTRVIDRMLNSVEKEETLDDLDENEVFERCLKAHDIPNEQRALLLDAYKETVTTIYENDKRAN